MLEIKVPTFKVVMIFLFLPLLMKLSYLQIIKGNHFYRKAKQQQEEHLIITSERGKIFDCRGRILAMDRNVYSVFINPRQVKDKAEIAEKLSQILNIDYQETFNKLKRDDTYFVWLKRGLQEGPLLDELMSLNITGLGIRIERRRIYPQEELASHLLGTVDIDNNGISGLELFYNDILSGRAGYIVTLEDGRNLILGEFCKTYTPAMNGQNLILTIDQVLQHYVEEEAERLYWENKAKRVSIVIMEPRYGDILALANRPTYSPNTINSSTIENMKNFAISDNFEPGSVFKVITAAILLQEGLANPEEKVYCENGAYRIGRRILHDYHKYGWLDFRSVIVNSSNIGVAKFASRLGWFKFYEQMKLFGIGMKTGIDLPGESSGFLRQPQSWTDYSITSIAMGQEVAVTTLQLAKVMSIIANGGYDVKPHIVKEIRDHNGVTIKTLYGKMDKRILSSGVAEELKFILKEVIERGTAKRAKSESYLAGGKSGTAQKADLEKGGYSTNKYVATFAGFLPLEAPQMVIVVTVDEPQPYHFGGVVCAPAFKRIAEKALVYLTVSQEKRSVEYEINRNFVWD